MIRVLVSPQVASYARRLHPEHRRRLKGQLQALAGGKGDIKPLAENLDGYWRLRIDPYRVVFRYSESGDILILFIERRRLIYDLLRSRPELLKWSLGEAGP